MINFKPGGQRREDGRAWESESWSKANAGAAARRQDSVDDKVPQLHAQNGLASDDDRRFRAELELQQQARARRMFMTSQRCPSRFRQSR